ncbi:hypothetical protein L1887_11372 [Cichorium endivia]|nr:hypothetical protein L1887_11372 [Cichorium endivia]
MGGVCTGGRPELGTGGGWSKLGGLGVGLRVLVCAMDEREMVGGEWSSEGEDGVTDRSSGGGYRRREGGRRWSCEIERLEEKEGDVGFEGGGGGWFA